MAGRRVFYDGLRASGTGGPIACVGIDPSPALLRHWSLTDDAAGALAFGRALLHAALGTAPVVKPQVAWFERFGVEGYRVLARLVEEAHEAGLLVIADAKRGDFGPSSDAYGQAWLGPAAPLRVDAITVSPYLGVGALEPIFELAACWGAYVFVVARSSNPEGETLQQAGSPPTWLGVVDALAERADRFGARTIGAVVGATAPADLKLALHRLPDALILAPGIGSQGATVADLRDLAVPLARVLASSSRGVAEQGPTDESLKRAVASLAAA